MLTLTIGIPQDSVLGPLMYVIYVNNIFNVNASVKCLHANHMVIIVPAKSKNELLMLANLVISLFYNVFF